MVLLKERKIAWNVIVKTTFQEIGIHMKIAIAVVNLTLLTCLS